MWKAAALLCAVSLFLILYPVVAKPKWFLIDTIHKAGKTGRHKPSQAKSGSGFRRGSFDDYALDAGEGGPNVKSRGYGSFSFQPATFASNRGVGGNSGGEQEGKSAGSLPTSGYTTPSAQPTAVTKQDETSPGSSSSSGLGGRCQIREGPGKGGTCVFPFTFKGKEYTKCSTENTGKLYNIGSWCPTVANDTMGPYSDTYGVCPEDCPGSQARITACTSYGSEVCRFPFQQNGYAYSGCIIIDGKPSCLSRYGQPMVCSADCPLDTEIETKELSAADIAKSLSTTGAGHFKSSLDEPCGAQLIKIWKAGGMDALEEVKKNCYPFNPNGRFLMAKRSGGDHADCEILCARTE